MSTLLEIQATNTHLIRKSVSQSTGEMETMMMSKTTMTSMTLMVIIIKIAKLAVEMVKKVQISI